MNSETDALESPARPYPLWLRLLVGRRPGWTLVRALFLVALSAVVFKFVLVPIQVKGTSMFPTYKDGKINFVNRLSYVSNPPRRGDIVAVRLAGPNLLILKRVVGLPGETVTIKQGVVHIDGKALDEPYVKSPVASRVQRIRPRRLDDHEYFLVGDNREVSEMYVKPDSEIVGKVLL